MQFHVLILDSIDFYHLIEQQTHFRLHDFMDILSQYQSGRVLYRLKISTPMQLW